MQGGLKNASQISPTNPYQIQLFNQQMLPFSALNPLGRLASFWFFTLGKELLPVLPKDFIDMF
jgi:hypothetical protein